MLQIYASISSVLLNVFCVFCRIFSVFLKVLFCYDEIFLDKRPSRIDMSKSVKVLVPLDIDISLQKKSGHSVDDDIVDLTKRIENQAKEEERIIKAEITYAVHKWCSSLPQTHQTRIAHIALKIHRRIASTICFLVAAFRMLSKLPGQGTWLQSILSRLLCFAISKGWCLNATNFRDYPFTPAELAVAAATYLERIPLNVPDDPFYTLSTIIGCLPLECSSLFSRATLTCPFCHATCSAPLPSHIPKESWTMKEWFSLATAITGADLHPWVQFHGWHAENAIEMMQKLDWISLVHGCCFSYNLQSMIFPFDA